MYSAISRRGGALGMYSSINSAPLWGAAPTASFITVGGVSLSSSSLPTDFASNRHWYDPIVGFLGDAGKDLLQAVKTWISNRIGQEAWERSPDSTKRAYVNAALSDLGMSATAAWLPWLIGGGAIVGFWWLSRHGGRRR